MKNRKPEDGDIVNMKEEKELHPLDPDPDSWEESSDTEIKQEKWGRKLEFLLSISGYCVGPGNLWRFPYICMRNGGGAFLIPFIILLFSLGLPLFMVEVILGQFSGRSVIGVWNICPIFKGIGIGASIASATTSWYYNLILAWTMYYIGNSFINPLPWSRCGQLWNSDNCTTDRHVVNVSDMLHVTRNSTNATFYAVSSRSSLSTNQSGLSLSANQSGLFLPANQSGLSRGTSSEEEFWQFNVLGISSGIDDVGGIQWHLVACFVGSWIIVYFCLAKGVKSLGKVVYVTATLPYILLVILLIRGVTLPGAVDGILFYITPDFNLILSPQVWMEAAIQIFYSCGIIWGGLITLASYNKFDNNCIRDSILLITIGEGTSIFGGFVVFSILGFMAHEVNVPVETVVKTGPGLGFIAYPEALMELPLPNLWAVLFFIMLYTLALDVVFACLEPTCAVLIDSFPALRKKRAIFMAVVVGIMVLSGLPLCTQGGMYIYQIVDWYIASFAVPLFGVMECIIVGWIYGAQRLSRDVEIMLGRGLPIYIQICLCFITPSILMIILVFIVVNYSLPSYGSYEYPVAAVMFGWFVALVPLVPVPIMAVIEIRRSSGDNLLQKIRNALRPNCEWKPACPSARMSYSRDNEYKHDTLMSTFKGNMCGSHCHQGKDVAKSDKVDNA